MSVTEALNYLADGDARTPAALKILERLADVGLGYVTVGRLIDSGKPLIVVGRPQAVTARADWSIDLGPGAGHDGERIVFEGTPAQLVAKKSTLTGQYFAQYVGP